MAPTSKRRMEHFQESVYGLSKFDLHQYYRAMDYLIDHKDEIEKNIFKAVEKYGISRVIFVGDRGMISYKNMAHLEKLGQEYVLGYIG